MLIIFFFSFQVLSYAGASHNGSPLSILIRSAQDISEDSSFHSQSVQIISRLLSHSSHLIQPAQSIFYIIQRCFFWVGPNPQVFSQDLTWLLLFSRRYSQILFQVWRKNELSSVKCFSPLSLKFFHRWFNLSNFHYGVPQQFMVVFLVVILGFWRLKKSSS